MSDQDHVLCRDCERHRPPELVSTSGLCFDCLGHTQGMPPTGLTGPGRQALRAALADYRERKYHPKLPLTERNNP